jgi:hypothetical protein
MVGWLEMTRKEKRVAYNNIFLEGLRKITIPVEAAVLSPRLEPENFTWHGNCYF